MKLLIYVFQKHPFLRYLAEMDLALEVRNLRKSFGNQEVVQDISFEIPQGEIFGLLGPNGAGKSTTINMIGGVTRVGSGSIKVFGYDNQTEFEKTRRLVGVMHQEIVIDPFFRMGQVLKLHSGYYGAKDDPEWRSLLIDRLALEPHLTKHMNKLSGGMKRRMMVAKALIHKPALVILDEPTAGVDVELRMALWDFVREINKKGTTVLLTTHHLEEAEEMCNRVAIMNHGKIIALDHTSSLIRRIDRKVLSLRFDTDVNEIPKSLSDLPYRFGESKKVIDFHVSRSMNAGEIIQKVYQEGLKVVEIETTSASLEDVFLELTGSMGNGTNANGSTKPVL